MPWLALCYVYQQAAGDGPDAFSHAGVRGAWSTRGVAGGSAAAGVDLSMYGFAVGDAVGLSLTTASIAGGEAGGVSANAASMLPAAAAGGDDGRALVARSESASEVVVPRVTTVLQAAAVKAPEPACPMYQHFTTELAIGAMSVTEQAESESSDDEALEGHARPRQQK
ncbi:hypothetical protein CYMTET_11681 [Cymbomonas tetramitiformis]|uniref:Uncharacterized protein n=1 Tax=Cymbomonas tetramitiformis TaxID=36881 RepID=A0AAE0GLV3_9CHLO|nr:hypothetical protein CYMTET_11681 [Cymbomonas tetramitiformis]